MHVLLSEHRNIHSIGFAIVTESMDGAGGWGQAYLLATTNKKGRPTRQYLYQESVGQCLRTGLVQLCATAVKMCVCGTIYIVPRHEKGR